MKKQILIILIFLTPFLCQSQTEKGNFHIGIGGLPIFYPDGSLETGYSLRANIGYFPVDKLAIGFMPFLGQVEEIKSQGASIYLRYYLLSRRTSLFLEAAAGLGRVQYDYSTNLNGTMSSYNIGPGVHFMLNDKISIELIAQYARLQNITHPESTLVSNTIIPTIGIQYYFK